MAGLVGYGSSDEEEEEIEKVVDVEQSQKQNKDQGSSLARANPPPETKESTHEASSDSLQNVNSSSIAQLSKKFPGEPTANLPIVGPSRPSQPSLSTNTISSGPGPSAAPKPDNDSLASSPTVPTSPYIAYREAMQQLTLPTIPNFSIPPSPPGSPPPGTDAKLAQFLRLKRQGIHFNEKLAASSALKNPSLLAKLMKTAGLVEDGKLDVEGKEVEGEVNLRQYETTIDLDLWNPNAFPPWAYKEELEKARVKADAAREKGKKGRTGLEFVKGPAETEERSERNSRFDR